jgi:phosphocarrier protein HPr
MQQTEVEIRNASGLHARPANQLVKTAKKFESQIWMDTGTKKIDAKNIVKVLSLGASQGTKVIISAEGPDESDAIHGLAELFEGGFGES